MKRIDAPPTTARPAQAPKTGGAQRASPVEQALVDRFRAALAEQGTREQQATTASPQDDAAQALSERGRHDEFLHQHTSEESAPASRSTDQSDLAPPLSGFATAAGQTAASVVSASGAAPAYNAAVVAQLLEKHVRQLLVATPNSAGSDQPAVVLNLTDAVLPGTQLTLTQTESGWRLDSQSSSTSSYRTVRDLAPQLQARFAERGLGELALSVTMREGQ